MKANLVGGQISIPRLELIADAVDPKLRPQIPTPQLSHSARALFIPRSDEIGFPAAGLREHAELALTDDMTGESIRIGGGRPFRVGEQIDLAMCLLERLRDSLGFEIACARLTLPQRRRRPGARGRWSPKQTVR